MVVQLLAPLFLSVLATSSTLSMVLVVIDKKVPSPLVNYGGAGLRSTLSPDLVVLDKLQRILSMVLVVSINLT